MNGGYFSSWVRPTTRLAVYLRSGLGCAWCLRDWSELAAGLTLDHVVPRGQCGNNGADNLIAACRPCNAAWRAACDAAAAVPRGSPWRNMTKYLGGDARWLKRRIEAQLEVPLAPFRHRAVVLHAAPPDWLQELRRRSCTALVPAGALCQGPQAAFATADTDEVPF